jgi:hypothetical protein
MDFQFGLLGLLYAYPLTLYAARLLFPLILPRDLGDANSEPRKANGFKVTWYLQLTLSLALVNYLPLFDCFISNNRLNSW